MVWTHALAALLFCAVALMQARSPTRLLPARALVAALGASALWALAMAGIGPDDVMTRVLESVRDLAWLGVLAALARAGDASRATRRGLAGVFVVTAACMVLPAVAAVLGDAAPTPQVTRRLATTALTLRMLAEAGALVLAYRVALIAEPRSRGGRAILVAAIALVWGVDLTIHVAGAVLSLWSDVLLVGRGIVMAAVASLIATAVQRDGDWTLRVSRALALQAAALAAAALYVVVTLVAIELLRDVAGPNARMMQTAFVFGTGAALAALASTPWLRSWSKVVLAKHLFRHRYDYRAEWVRFTATLAEAGEAAPLEERVVKAVADLTDSPAGLLLVAREGTLEAGAAWNCASAPVADGEPLARHLRATQRIVALDSVRAGTVPVEEAAAVPGWLAARDDAWALVPLIHAERLVGALVLSRPPVGRALDWEDFDLLGIAGRQVASYLAEDRAHAALSDARRFEEFNRRFAFILHDLKNLVSQTALVARNAERHADNPAFRADMIATLKDCSQRMTGLLARLGQQARAPEAPVPVPLLALAERLAATRRSQHPVSAAGDAQVCALADPAALETVLGHLIQNAVEASATDRPVEIAVAGNAIAATIDVIDRGCGMSAAFVRDELFRPFASSKVNGFGLGAFEARQLVEAMGGALLVESRVGEGTRFRIRMPVAQPAAWEEAA